MSAEACNAKSKELRLAGNANYRTALSSRSVNDKRRFFWQAIDKYREVIQLPQSLTEDLHSLSLKNLGVVNKELALLEWGQGNHQRSWTHIYDCVDYYAKAVLNCQNRSKLPSQQQWQQELIQQAAKHVQLMYEKLLECKTDAGFVKNLYILCTKLSTLRSSSIEFLEVTVAIMVDLANRQLHLGVSLHSQKQFVPASAQIADMYFPLQEAQRLAAKNSELANNYESELKTLQDDYEIQDSIYRSRVDLEAAKSFLQNLDGDSKKWMDEALLACDHLRAALNLISDKGLDIALEAEICSHLGNTHLKVLNSESTAKALLHQTVQLVLCFLSDKPQHCRNEPWFAAAERGLNEIQQREAKRQDEERIKELEEDGTLDKIKKHFNQDLDSFITFIYSEFKFVGKEPPDSTLSKKKRLLGALSHFHPDKSDVNNRRQFWIHEEVSKYLNLFYEREK